MPSNLQSILAGITRGVTASKRSAGLTGSNVKTDNPQTYAWIGQETNDLRQPIQKEQTQNPSLPFGTSSGGTQYAYTNPLPTDIRTLISEGSPGTDISPSNADARVGSLLAFVPGIVPANASMQLSGYGMSPQNGDHFKYYFANQINSIANTNVPYSANVLTHIQEQANLSSDGSSNVWHNAAQAFATMRKGYVGIQPYRVASQLET